MDINLGYQDAKMKKKIYSVLEKEKIVQLQQFFSNDLRLLKRKIEKMQTKKVNDILFCKYLYVVPDDYTKKELRPCIDFIEKITKQKIKKIQIILAKHTDYSVINDKQKAENGYVAILDMNEAWDTSWGGLLYYRYGDKEKKEVPCMYN